MKIQSIILASIFVLASTVSAAFTHPGVRSASKYELDFVKEKIKAGAQPWTAHLNSAKTAGSDSKALGLALNWYMTGDVASANGAITALKSWNGHAAYQGGDGQSALEGAWAASVLAPAAEIMSQYPGWSDADKTATKNMFKTVFLPAMLKMSTWNGNVDLTQLDALLSIAVFLDDQTSFDAGIARLKLRLPAYFYLASDAPSVRAYANGTYNWSAANGCAPVKWMDGISPESCRDNGHHLQFAIAGALSALETAYIQGVDLYTPNQERMVDAMELLSLQLSSKSMQGACPNNSTRWKYDDDDRYNTLEIGYNHYHNRKNVPMPETLAEITKELRNGKHQFNMFHETLTNAEIVYTNMPSSTTVASSSSKVASSSSGKLSSSSGKPSALNAIQSAWNMSVQGESLILNAVPGTQVNVSIVNLLGNQRKTLFAGAANGNMSLVWGAGMTHGRYILTVQVGHESRQALVSVLGN
jgi:hypothetical protein